MASFKWTGKRNKAAVLLADGYTIEETAREVNVSERTVSRWKADINFLAEVDRLSLMIGIANRGERLRIAKRIIRERISKQVKTQKDLLEWLKYAQSETDGVKLDLTTLFDAATSVAGSGPDGDDSEESGEDEGGSDTGLPE